MKLHTADTRTQLNKALFTLARRRCQDGMLGTAGHRGLLYVPLYPLNHDYMISSRELLKMQHLRMGCFKAGVSLNMYSNGYRTNSEN